MNSTDRKKRILAYGEHSGHCHVLTGDVTFDEKGHILVGEDSNAVLKHIMEKDWMESEKEVWTGEHHDIPLAPGLYAYVPQQVFDPLTKRIEAARD